MGKRRAPLKPVTTKKALVRSVREKQMLRWIIGATVLLAVVVFGLIGYGWLETAVLEPRRPIAEINGELVTMRQFQARVRLLQLDLISQVQSTQQLRQMFAGNEDILGSIEAQLETLNAQLTTPSYLGQLALNQLIDEALLRQKAPELGLAVTEAEINEAIQQAFGYFAAGTPTPLPTATSDPALTPVPAVPTATATAGPSPTPAPTATPYTEDLYRTNYRNYLANLSDIDVLEAEFRSQFAASLFQERLFELLKSQEPREQEHLFIRHILNGDPDLVEQARQRLELGEDWSVVAEALSLEPLSSVNAGELGWMKADDLLLRYGAAFRDLALSAELGVLVGPVQTSQGWQIFQVLEREVRPMDDTAFQNAVQLRYNRLLDEWQESGTVVINDSWLLFVPALDEVRP